MANFYFILTHLSQYDGTMNNVGSSGGFGFGGSSSSGSSSSSSSSGKNVRDIIEYMHFDAPTTITSTMSSMFDSLTESSSSLLASLSSSELIQQHFNSSDGKTETHITTTTTASNGNIETSAGVGAGAGGVASSSSSSKIITTKIVGFADNTYKEIALQWYKRLLSFGYTEHYVVTADEDAAEFFRINNVKYDYLFDITFTNNSSYNNTTHHNSNSTLLSRNSPTKLVTPLSQCVEEEGIKEKLSKSKQNQNYRRHLFGSRWNYILRQLQGIGNKNNQRYHILLTDVDNVFVRYANITEEIENTPFDAYHAYEGRMPSFPKNYWYIHGFTICGGMSWFRSTPAVIEFVNSIATGCGCDDIQYVTCNCRCDDQQMINSKIFSGPYKIQWDRKILKPSSEIDLDWDSLTGTCKKTKHRVKVWDKHTAYRGAINGNRCPHRPQSWIAMPSGIDDKLSMPNKWDNVCGPNSNGNISWVPTPRTTELEHWTVRAARRENEKNNTNATSNKRKRRQKP